MSNKNELSRKSVKEGNLAASIRLQYIPHFHDMDERLKDEIVLKEVINGSTNISSLAASIRMAHHIPTINNTGYGGPCVDVQDELEELIDGLNFSSLVDDKDAYTCSDIATEERMPSMLLSTLDTLISFADIQENDCNESKRRKSVSNKLKSLHSLAQLTDDVAAGTLRESALVSGRGSIFHAIEMRKNDRIFAQDEPKRRPLLASIIMSKKFMLYRHRFANAQYNRKLLFHTLPQPNSDTDLDEVGKTEMTRTRARHRFIITADTQFGILMDGYDMKVPTWQTEIEISRECVNEINSMKGEERPLFVCVCGDLVDTEGSFSGAQASWKNVMKVWERKFIFDQQIKDWKEVWARLDEDIALVCLCGNHDVGNRPTAESIQKWTSAFGSDYLAFWINGTYNIGMNNCIFNDPSGAMHLYEEQLAWLEERLEYASARKASQIFVYSHYPWFITHEDEEDATMSSASTPPTGWGAEGSKFPDYYFNIPVEYRKVVLNLFRKYNVKACFSGHFHQNVVNKTSWGMDMIITGPLSMMLHSTSQAIANEQQTIGMRVVDVDKDSFQHEFIPLEKHIYCQDCKDEEKETVVGRNRCAVVGHKSCACIIS